jgi:hypothetical protein
MLRIDEQGEALSPESAIAPDQASYATELRFAWNRYNTTE